MSTDKREEVENLVIKAAKAGTSEDAMRFSQAACNAANAMRVLLDTEHTQSSHGSGK
jgi:hypothetical protein